MNKYLWVKNDVRVKNNFYSLNAFEFSLVLLEIFVYYESVEVEICSRINKLSQSFTVKS